MEALVTKLRRDFPSLAFVEGPVAHWSAQAQSITYTLTDSTTEAWTLLHELGHALLGHAAYTSDTNLLQKEVEAWQQAERLAPKYGLAINDDYIQQCLDTYREWLHKRSTCPTCGTHGLQQPDNAYTCLNCRDRWQVTKQRFCRPYRLKSTL